METDPWSLHTAGGPGAEEEPEGDSEGVIDEAGEEQEINMKLGAQERPSGRTESGLRMTRADQTCI